MQLLYILFSIATANRFIKNVDVSLCRNCIHYKPYNNEVTSSIIGGCDKFGEKNIITGEIKYEHADICRNNEDLCGRDAKFFEEDDNIEIKIAISRITDNASIIMVLLLLAISIMTSVF